MSCRNKRVTSNPVTMHVDLNYAPQLLDEIIDYAGSYIDIDNYPMWTLYNMLLEYERILNERM